MTTLGLLQLVVVLRKLIEDSQISVVYHLCQCKNLLILLVFIVLKEAKNEPVGPVS